MFPIRPSLGYLRIRPFECSSVPLPVINAGINAGTTARAHRRGDGSHPNHNDHDYENPNDAPPVDRAEVALRFEILEVVVEVIEVIEVI